jgi:uncharacterized repeat protein (TIGR01451 family)
MLRNLRNRTSLIAASVLLALTFLPTDGLQAAERWPSSDLLLPCFEVRLDGTQQTPPSLTTLFAVVNSADRPVPIRISVQTNWGIEVLQTTLTLEPYAVKTVNMADWTLRGIDPADPPGAPPALNLEELEHLQTALCGLPSPMTDEFYSTAMDLAPPLRMVGSIVVRALDRRDDEVLWGDFFIVERGTEYTQGEVLANLDRSLLPGPEDDDDLCTLHALRYLNGGGFHARTDFMVWTDVHARPALGPDYEGRRIPTIIDAYGEDGTHLATLHLALLPMEMVSVADLALPEAFGWLKVDTLAEEAMIIVRYNAEDSFSVGMEAFCLRRDPDIRIEKATNGFDADQPPGPQIPPGDPVEWTYVVTNTGTEPLIHVVVTDTVLGAIACPKDTLEPGESMTCVERGFAAEGCPEQYSNVGLANGTDPTGRVVRDRDPSHYHTGGGNAAVQIRKYTNQIYAPNPTGPFVNVGDPVHWEYVITNTGTVDLTGVTVSDSKGVVVTCPGTALPVGAPPMTCTAQGVATEGQYSNTGVVTASWYEGDDLCATAQDRSRSHYYGQITCPDDERPGISIEKYVNGADVEAPPGLTLVPGAPVHWDYTVTNIGTVDLVNVLVTDSEGVVVTCPRNQLDVGMSMTCTGDGVAVEGPYSNRADATGQWYHRDELCAQPEDFDWSYYTGEGEACPPGEPSIDLKKYTNEFYAPDPPGPTFMVGEGVGWQYVVTNTGDVPLSNIVVTDSEGVTVYCPGASLAVGADMICNGYGEVVEGQYSNTGLATGEWWVQEDLCGRVRDADLSHYYGIEEAVEPDRMTGGGSVFTEGARYTHGFTLRCGGSPNNLEINWDKNVFHLTSLTAWDCIDDPLISEIPPVAGFDTFEGAGVGRLNQVDGALIEFVFKDAGEPGKNDWAWFRITPPSGPVVEVGGYLHNGDHQAHGH